MLRHKKEIVGLDKRGMREIRFDEYVCLLWEREREREREILNENIKKNDRTNYLNKINVYNR